MPSKYTLVKLTLSRRDKTDKTDKTDGPDKTMSSKFPRNGSRRKPGVNWPSVA